MRGFGLSILCLGAQFFLAGPLFAALTISIQEVSSNVQATFSGSINNQALPFQSTYPATNGLESNGLNFHGLFGGTGTYWFYQIPGSQPFSPLGTLNRPFDSVNSSSVFGFAFVTSSKRPAVAVSSPNPGNFSSSTVGTWRNTTISALGLTPGTDTWKWGSGSQASSLTIQIGSLGSTAIPEPNSFAFLTIGAISTLCTGIGRRRTRSKRP